MKAKIENGQIEIYPTLPNVCGQTINFQQADKETLEANGFYDVIIPALSDNEERGEIYFDSDEQVFKYHIKEKQEVDEILQRVQRNDELRRQYSQRISDIEGMREALERFAIDGTPIPQDIIEQREQLKQEYNNLIKDEEL